MKHKQHSPGDYKALRQQAERVLQAETVSLDQMSEADVAALVHELRVHQIELEMQNEELRRAQTELEESRSKYSDLFDFAPVGYLVFDSGGIVVEANLTAAAMLGVDRRNLANAVFTPYVHRASRDTWRAHLQAVFTTGAPRECEVELERPDHATLVVRLRSEPGKNASGKVVQCRTTMTDVTALTRAERRLRESERRFRTLAENAPDVIARVDRQMRVQYVNRPIELALGIPPEQFVGRTFEELGVPAEMDKKWTAAIEGVFQTAKLARTDLDCPTPKGLRHFAASIVPEFEEDRSVNTVIVTVRDVTDRVHAEEKYSAVIRNLQDGFCILDSQGRYVEVNDTCCRMLGREREELLQMNILDVWEPQQREELTSHLQKAARDGVDKFQMRHRRKDGCRLDCAITVQRLSSDRFFLFARDVTDQQVAEEQRLESLRRLELVAQATDDGIWDWDIAADTLWHNEAYVAAFGYDPGQVKASIPWWRERIHPQDRDAVLATLDEVLKSGQDRWSSRYRFQRQDGSYAWVVARGYVLRDAQGQAVRMVGSMLDMTERMELLDQLEDERTKLTTILETAFSAMIVVDDQGSIRYANPTAQELHGQPIPYGGGVESHRHMGLYYPDGRPYQPSELPLLRSAFHGETYRGVEMLLKRPDGETRHILVNTDALRDRGGKILGAVAVIQDISKLKHAEQALREAHDELEERVRQRTLELDETISTLHEEVEERLEAQEQLVRQNDVLRKIVDNIPVMLWFYDAQGKVTMVNEQFSRVLGYTLTDLEEADVMERLYPDPALRQEAWEYLRAGQSGWRDFVVQAKDGSQVISSWASVRLTNSSYLGIGLDIRERQRFEECLREGEERYRTLVELSPDAIGVVRGGIIQFVNSTAVKLLGAESTEQIVGRSTLDFVPPGNKEEVDQRFKSLRRHRRPLPPTEGKIVRLDGKELDVEMTAIPITFENRNAYQVILRDITQRKQVENRLWESTQRLQQQAELLDLAHDSIVVNDMDGRIAFWNRGAEQTYGWTREEALGKISHELLQTQFPLNLIEITAKLLSQGRWNGELTHTTRSGTTIAVSSRWALQRDPEGRPTGILVIDRDITQQKHAEQATLEARQFAESIIHTIQESLLVLDRGLKVVTANQTFYRTFQVRPEETEGRFIYDIGNRQWDIPRLRTLLEDILPHNTSLEGFEVEHKFERIGRRTMLLNARRIQPQTQETERILLAIEDITIRKEQEQKIQEHQQQLASLTEELLLTEERERRRIAVILHDSIGQSLAFSKRELGVVQKNTPETVREAIEYIKKQIDDAIRQTRNLTFELSPSTLHTFGLEAAVEELAEQFAQRENFRYHFEATEENKPLTEQVKTLLYRAARELLTNVVKHAKAPDVFLRIDRMDGNIRMVIEDNGKGFDTAQIEQGLGRQKGFGLLSIRERLTHIGGTFAIESEPGRGTKVTLTAPLRSGNS